LAVNTYKVTLVAAFVPLFAGLFWKQATTRGALCAIGAGLVAWLATELLGADQTVVPPQLAGLAAAAVGMIAGSYASQRSPVSRA
jgi:solute:Na+ symporter, SSS family